MTYTNNLTYFLINKINTLVSNYNPSIIIDAGSRNLDQSIEFALAFPNAQILSFEPNPSEYEICVSKSKNYNNIKVFPYAVSDTDGMAQFYVTPHCLGTSSLLEPKNVPNNPCGYHYNEINVKTIRLDTFLKEENIKKIDILWMDIQGGELFALKGLGHHIHNIDFIECEASKLPYYKNHPVLSELEKFFDDNNFDHNFYLPWEGPPHDFIEGELVCVNKKLFQS